MKTLNTLLIISCLITACTAQNKIYKRLPLGTMEKFDIETFNKQKNEFGQFMETKDNVEISKGWTEFDKTYGESITLNNDPSSYYMSLCKFYFADGSLKERGYYYTLNKSFFLIGIWEYFDANGKLIKTEDFDKQYKINYKKALEIVAKKYGFQQKNLSINIVGDNWFIKNVKGSKRGRASMVNTLTGKSDEGPVHVKM